ncbi:MAG: ATP-binding cassette domain-containing protein [Spirochaetes bacterium]|nr:ATP-binding cassette domain-containing protein [Spirochaetota bacterium]
MLPLIEFIDVTCAADEPLNGVSFRVARGENALFFGIEGSGLKSIAPLMIGLEESYEGEVRYRGAPTRGLDYLAKLRHKNGIGYLHGDYGLISNMSVEENIALRLEYFSDYSPEEIREITGRMMRELHIYDRRAARPVELTGSQILRTAYGRAAVNDPDLLIIEHALVGHSALDLRSFMDMLRARTAHPDRSVVFITYDPQKFVDFADAFHMLYKGRIVFSGSRSEFLESDNPYLVQFRNVSPEGPMDIP